MFLDALYIVIPAYNEEANIESVAREWHDVVRRTGPESRLVIVDDGSRDGTLDILHRLQEELPQLVPLTKPNAGHGPTLLFGYRYALEQGADFVFQTDSDGQTLPGPFGRGGASTTGRLASANTARTAGAGCWSPRRCGWWSFSPLAYGSQTPTRPSA